MVRTSVAVLVVGILLCACTTPAPVPRASLTQRALAPTPTTTLPTQLPTATPTRTATSTPTHAPQPTSTPAPTRVPPTRTPTPSPTPTPTPRPEDTQIYIGIPPEAILRQPPYARCGGFGIWTMDHDPGPGALDFWQAHPAIPQPEGWTHRTRDARLSPDYCTDVGYPIAFLQEQGVIESARPDDGVMTVLITEGVGGGLLLVFGHVDMDIDRETPGMHYLPIGSAVREGDIIAYTGRAGIPPDVDPSTNFGIIIPGVGYHPDQEMMLIGPDGQPNILY